jgi:branched-chain amino acid transport system ATP-binding protein
MLGGRRRVAVRERARALLDRVGLGEHADRPAGLLPAGMQKRLEVARALALAPRLLLLDEPFAGLAGAETRALAALIAALRAEGLTVVLAEHRTRLAMSLADRVAILDHGVVIASGSVERVRRDLRILEPGLGGMAAAAG